ncbi:MAG: alpha-L-fucosidase [Acidobacteriota bacterium]
MSDEISRRSFVKRVGAAGSAIAFANANAVAAQEKGASQTEKSSATLKYQEETRARRLRWWREAKFGMFIHFGLYSVIGHQEWVMESEGVPVPQYEILAQHFKPKVGFAREWARLAKKAGQKYMVMTAKHHEGFCLWDTKLTNYNSMQQGVGRDVVKEFVDAARAEGLRVGLYYSLMDWHHPDGAICATDAAARERFVSFTHGLVRELLTNYGKIDVLWYDVDWPLTPEQWRADEMNRMVFQLQPEIVVNNRNGLVGDFSTPEHKIVAADRAWETCDTMNLGWGYQRNDSEWKSTKRIVNDLTTCAQQGGNYLLNIGPEMDGTVPTASVKTLEEVGAWLAVNGEAIYGTDGGASISFGNYDNFTRKGNTLYVHVYFWPSKTPAAEWIEFYKPAAVVAIGGVQAKVLSARLLKTGKKVEFTQDVTTLRLTGLPEVAPDEPVTVIAVECDRPPVVDHHSIRPKWNRYGVGTRG